MNNNTPLFDYDTAREAYTNNRMTHSEFYSTLAQAISYSDLRSILPSRYYLSNDDNLNDIPLYVWDERHYQVQFLLNRAMNQQRIKKKQASISLAESVCLLKFVARNEMMYCLDCTSESEELEV
ncbi:hypothetical protein [Vagococcus xieshaowenii]|uniref:Uncharacterized protein n=1 Tax=Vagococcus xieshaowenii TaxID=2562451 RepID=A0AAJ5EE14_9ENTE|nr:hypothetical protein [Vagococcus xieshaowenii]QCA29472.1 hypothetical protein E4Z98_09130 [Vagococcus xieshaowenii]TFZ39602.1 hypothetical protein E4031_08615 [Vagococcus xieshaowenii]